MTQVRIDDIHANPYAVWRDLGSPEVLSRDAYVLLASHMEPAILEHRQPMDAGPLRIAMSPSSVSLLIIDDAAQHRPVTPHPEISSVKRYHGQNGEPTVFVRWQQATDRVVAYDIHVAHDQGGFQQVNNAPVFDLGFLYVLPEDADPEKLRFRVRVREL